MTNSNDTFICPICGSAFIEEDNSDLEKINEILYSKTKKTIRGRIISKKGLGFTNRVDYFQLIKSFVLPITYFLGFFMY